MRERIYRWFCACIPGVRGGAARAPGSGEMRIGVLSERKKEGWDKLRLASLVFPSLHGLNGKNFNSTVREFSTDCDRLWRILQRDVNIRANLISGG